MLFPSLIFSLTNDELRPLLILFFTFINDFSFSFKNLLLFIISSKQSSSLSKTSILIFFTNSSLFSHVFNSFKLSLPVVNHMVLSLYFSCNFSKVSIVKSCLFFLILYLTPQIFRFCHKRI